MSALEAAAKAAAGLPGKDLPFVERLRERGLDAFNKAGLPTTRDESFRFTSLDPLRKTEFAPAAGALPDAKKGALRSFDAYRLVFVDGRLQPDLSDALPRGAALGSLAAFLKLEPKKLEPYLGKAGPLTALSGLNAALFTDGAVLFLPKGVALDKPVHLLFAAAGGQTVSHARVLVVAEAGSKAVVVEERFGPAGAAYWTSVHAEVFVGENARVDYVSLQREGPGAYHTAALDVRVERAASFAGHALSFGAALARHDLRVQLEGEGAECDLSGLYVVSGRQHVDHHTVVEHQKPHGTSRELYKGVLDESARAVFNGLIDVKPQAQKTDANVYNKNLLLSQNGLVNTNPEFRIHANDVQCRHGATIGQLREEALFYLRSRGVGAAEARALLVYAFASEMLEKLPVEALREALGELLQSRLGGAR